MMCGASVAAPPSSPSARGPRDGGGARDATLRYADAETRRFMRAVVSRPAPFTFVFLSACIFLFLLMKAAGVDENPAVLVAYGAKVNRLIDRGEWWRFVTPIFLHGGPVIGWIHLLVNMYGLFMLGPYVEKLYGSAKFTVFWVLAGIGGTVASYLTVRPGSGDGALARFLFREADLPSVGASGALFGLVGVLFVFGIKFRRELPEGFKRAFGTGMLPMIAINVFIGFSVDIIDNAAHLGGLAAGVLVALFTDFKRPGPRGPVAFAWHAAQGAALAVVVVSFAMVAYNFKPAPSNVAYIQAMNEGQEAFRKALGEESDAGATRAAAEKLAAVPPLDPEADRLREELRAIVERAAGFAAEVKAQPQPQTEAALAERVRRLEQFVADFEEWEGRSDAWVEREGPRLDIWLVKPTPAPEGGQQQQQ